MTKNFFFNIFVKNYFIAKNSGKKFDIHAPQRMERGCERGLYCYSAVTGRRGSPAAS